MFVCRRVGLRFEVARSWCAVCDDMHACLCRVECVSLCGRALVASKALSIFTSFISAVIQR